MSIEAMKNHTFPAVSYEQWQDSAVGALKGKPFESLLTKTIEGVTLQPFYTKKSLEELGDALEHQVQAVRNGKFASSFLIAQEVEAFTSRIFLNEAKDALSRGNETVVYSGMEKLHWEEPELKELAELITAYPLYFKLAPGDDSILNVFNFVPEQDRHKLRGVILSEEATDGPAGIRTQCADLVPVHHAGATAVQELGVALSRLAEIIDAEHFEESASNCWVRFAVHTDFFSEIAKLRAFRVLWHAFSSAYGHTPPSLPVHTETSLRSFSKLDPFVNLLRAGNSTFSAVLGGTDAHTVQAHDILTGTSPLGRRIARNIQLVIKAETFVSHVQDAAAGSYYIEQLTHAYTEAAWTYFLAIEEAGGYSEAVRSGWLADSFQAKWQERERQAATRKLSLVGTNKYADPSEQLPDESALLTRPELMTAKRLAEPFEQIRKVLSKSPVKTGILHLGPLKEVKVKSDFVKGVLAVGGLEPEISGPSLEADQIAAFVKEKGVSYAVLVGDALQLEKAVPALKDLNIVFDVAGRFSSEEMERWKQFGISGAVHAGQNILGKLEEIASAGKGGN